MNKFTVAVLQMDSQDNVEQNLHTASAFIEEAAARGAKLITMPENMHYVGRTAPPTRRTSPGDPPSS